MNASTRGRPRGGLDFVVAALLATVAATGCSRDSNDGGGSSGTPANTGAVTVQVTDAAYPYDVLDSVNVSFSTVSLRGTDGKVVPILPAGAVAVTGSASVAQIQSAALSEVNLLALRNGATADIANGIANIDSYTSVLVTITGVRVQLKDGRTMAAPAGTPAIDLELPLLPNLGVTQNSQSTILVDFDLARSLVLSGITTTAGSVTGFSFTPTARAMVRGAGGNIEGQVTSPTGQSSADADVKVVSSGTTIASTKTDADGRYKVLELTPGTYVVTAEKGDLAVIGSAVPVQQGQTAKSDLKLQVQ